MSYTPSMMRRGNSNQRPFGAPPTASFYSSPPYHNHVAFTHSRPAFASPDEYHRFHDSGGSAPQYAPLSQEEMLIARLPDMGHINPNGSTLRGAEAAYPSAQMFEPEDWGAMDASLRVGSEVPAPSSAQKRGSARKVNRRPKPGEASSGLLTRKFIELIKSSEDGVLDLNSAATTLQVELDRLRIEERALDDSIVEMQERLARLSENEDNKQYPLF
eukprot:jgi/Mesen1/6179/ME000032S05469